MTFVTLTFFAFLAVVFLVYWSLPRQVLRNVVLVLASYFFYGWWDYRFCALMLIASLVDYTVGILLDRTSSRARRRLLLAVTLATNLGILGFFKYFNFFAENAAGLASMLGMQLSWVEWHIILPVGISFYTFQTLGYTIDVFRGTLRPERNLINYLAFVSFFPQLVAGPIERATNLLPQFQSRRVFDYDQAVDGCRQFLWGFFKKVALADRLGEIVDAVYGQPDLYRGPALAVATVAFAFQIYCDFSAYSDMAIGTARLFGIRLMRNFAHPYLSQSVAEFWRRWHISLSTWFRDYVYVPLGGSRVSAPRRGVNIMITFGLSGLWHGASWNFLLWGLLNGLFVLPESLRSPSQRRSAGDVPGGDGRLPSPQALLKILLTFTLICVTWVFFRASTLSTATKILARIATELHRPSLWEQAASLFEGSQLKIALLVAGLIVIEWLTRRHPHPLQPPFVQRAWLPVRWAAFTVLLWTPIFMASPKGGSFIYFQF